MAWTNIAKRAVGYAIPKTWLDTFIDNLTYLYNALGGSGGTALDYILNGSFENDVDVDGIPDGWDQTLYTGGSAAIITTGAADAKSYYRFTHPGGAGNGGGYIDSSYVTCSVLRAATIGFAIKSSVVDIHNAVDIRWYDEDKGYISTSNIYDDEATNPTDWAQKIGSASPPATAKYYKVRLSGGVNDNVNAGTTAFDDVRVISSGAHTVVGYAENTVSAGAYGDRIYINGSIASPTVADATTDGLHSSMFGVASKVSGGGSITASIREVTNARTTVTLALPTGLWTIYASGYWRNGDTGSVIYEGNITAMAIREN